MEYLLRSMLFIPAHNPKFLHGAPESPADAVIFDLEDAVPESMKETARKNLEDLLSSGAMQGRQVFVRVNEIGTETFMEEMALVRFRDLTGFVVPKLQTREEMEKVDALVGEQERLWNVPEGKTRLLPLIETASAVLNLQDLIRGSGRIVALLFGGEDYLDSVWGRHDEPPKSLEVPRALVAMAARANGLLPIDTPYLDLRNEEGFIAEEKESAAMGYAGVLLVTPRQIPWAHKCFSPGPEEVSHARAVLEAVKEAKERGDSIAKLDGRMIGPPMRKRAEKVMEIQNAIEAGKRTDAQQLGNT